MISFWNNWQVVQGKGLSQWTSFWLAETSMASKNNEAILAVSISLTCAGLIILVIIIVIFLILQKR